LDALYCLTNVPNQLSRNQETTSPRALEVSHYQRFTLSKKTATPVLSFGHRLCSSKTEQTRARVSCSGSVSSEKRYVRLHTLPTPPPRRCKLRSPISHSADASTRWCSKRCTSCRIYPWRWCEAPEFSAQRMKAAARWWTRIRRL